MLKGCRRITGGAGDSVTTGGGAGDSVTTGGGAGDSVTTGGGAGDSVTTGGGAGDSVTTGGGASDSVTTGGGAGDSVTTGGAGVDSVFITGACEVWLEGGGEGHLGLRGQQLQHRRASQTVANTTAASKKRANFEFICKNQRILVEQRS